MKTNKKAILSAAAVLGVAGLVAGGTIAYFTDTETKSNQFTIGSVDVTLYESQLHRVNANMASASREGTLTSAALSSNLHLCSYLVDGAINAYCTPNIAAQNSTDGVSAYANGHVRKQNIAGTGVGQSGVFTDAQIKADAIAVQNGTTSGDTAVAATASNPGNYAGYIADEYQGLVPGKQVRKFIYVENTGNSPAYIRVKITIPAAVKNLVTVKDPHTPQEECAQSNNVCIQGAANQNINGDDFSNHKYVTKLADSENDNGDKVMTFVYTDALLKDEMTYWSPITTVKINDNVEQDDLSALTAPEFGITVDVDAIQSEGFASATAAFAAYDAQ